MRMDRKLILVKLNLVLISDTPLNRSIPSFDKAYGWHLLFIWILLEFDGFALLSLNYLRLYESLWGYYLTGIISFGFDFNGNRLLTIALVDKFEPTLRSLLSRRYLGTIRNQLLRTHWFRRWTLRPLLISLYFHQVDWFMIGCARSLNNGLRNRLSIIRALWRQLQSLRVILLVFIMGRLLMIPWLVIIFFAIDCTGGRQRLHCVVWGGIIACGTTVHNDNVLGLWLVLVLLLLLVVFEEVSISLIGTKIQLSNPTIRMHLEAAPSRFLLSAWQGLLFLWIHWSHKSSRPRTHCIFASFLDLCQINWRNCIRDSVRSLGLLWRHDSRSQRFGGLRVGVLRGSTLD